MIAVPSSTADFRLSTRADTAVVAVIGELDLASAPELAAVLDALAGRDHDRIVVECDELSFIDASGLGILAAAQARLGASAGEIRVHGLSAFAYRVFEITGLVDVMHAERQNASSHSEVEDEGDTDRLASRASRLAAESARADVVSEVLSHITTLASKFIAPCDGASVTLRRGEQLITAAASDETVRHLDGVQYAGRDGPCVNAADEGVQIHSPALVDERRWRPFTTQARERGMESVLSSPLTVGDQSTGALNLYSRTPAAFHAADQDLAIVFATLTSLLFHQPDETTAHQFDERIRDALVSRDVIAQAQGVLMARLGIHAQDAYETLRRDSASTSIPLRQGARDLVDETQNRAIAHDPDGPANE